MQFLHSIGLIDVLRPLMGVVSASSSSSPIIRGTLGSFLQKTAWTCFRLIAFSAFQGDEQTSGDLSGLQVALLQFLLEILSQTARFGKFNLFVCHYLFLSPLFILLISSNYSKLVLGDVSIETTASCASALRLLVVVSADHSHVHKMLASSGCAQVWTNA